MLLWGLTLLFRWLRAGKRWLLRLLLWLSWWLALLIVYSANTWLLSLRIGVTLVRQAPNLPPSETSYLRR